MWDDDCSWTFGRKQININRGSRARGNAYGGNCTGPSSHNLSSSSSISTEHDSPYQELIESVYTYYPLAIRDFRHNKDQFAYGSVPRLLYKKIEFDISGIIVPQCGFNGSPNGPAEYYMGIKVLNAFKNETGEANAWSNLFNEIVDGNDIEKRIWRLALDGGTQTCFYGNTLDSKRKVLIKTSSSSDGILTVVLQNSGSIDNSISLYDDPSLVLDNNDDLYFNIFERMYSDIDVLDVSDSDFYRPYKWLNATGITDSPPSGRTKYVGWVFDYAFVNGYVLGKKGATSLNVAYTKSPADANYNQNNNSGYYQNRYLDNTRFHEAILNNTDIKLLMDQNSFTEGSLSPNEDFHGISQLVCTPEGGSVNTTIETGVSCEDYTAFLKLNIGSNSSESGTLIISGVDLYGKSKTIEVPSSGSVEVDLMFINANEDLVLNFNTNDTDLSDNLDIEYVSAYGFCPTECKSELVNEYHPLMNFNNHDYSDVELMNSNNYQDPFRSDKLIIDNFEGVDLVLQPIYDNTINLIINDKRTKVKLINSRIAFNPSDKIFSIPQNSGYNDNNVYCKQHPNRTELILRSEKQMHVDIDNGGVSEGGRLISGSYVYYFRYIDADGNTTDIEAHTLPLNAVNFSEEFISGAKEGEYTNSKMSIRLSNVDLSFNGIEVYYSHTYGDLNQNTDYYKVSEKLPILLNDVVRFEFNGMENVEKLTQFDLIKFYNHHKSVETAEQSKNRLNLGNIKNEEISQYEKIQELATKHLRIKEYLKVYDYPDFYAKPNNAYRYSGYWRGETYQLGLSLNLTKGGSSPVFYPRGIDNISGSGDYSTTGIADFSGLFGENPYGIYRTKKDTEIMKIVGGKQRRYIVQLQIDGIEEFLTEAKSLFPNMIKGWGVLRTNRLNDVITQGYISPTFKMKFGGGYSFEITNKTVSSTEGPGFEVEGSKFMDPSSNEEESDPGTLLMAPFRCSQVYYDPNATVHGGHTASEGFAPVAETLSGETEDNEDLKIKTLLLKKSKPNETRFAFLSGDLQVDAEHMAAEFNGSDKYYYVSQNPTFFNLGWGAIGDNHNVVGSLFKSAKELEENTFGFMLKADNDVRNDNNISSSLVKTYYIPDESVTNSNNHFSSKIDTTTLNYFTTSFIGNKAYSSSAINSLLYTYENEENPFGLLANVYNNDGPLSHKSWRKVYSNVKYNNEFFFVSAMHSIDSTPSSINIANGDCFVSNVTMRLLYKNGLKDNFDNYSDIWDYKGEVGSRDFMNDTIDLDSDPAKQSWFDDTMLMMIRRARLINKGLWVNMYQESSHNLELRHAEFKDPIEQALYGKKRDCLFSNTRKLRTNHIAQEMNSSQLETKGYNKGYDSSKGAQLRYSVNDYEKILKEFYTRIESSDIAIKSFLKNGYREFYGINYKDYETSYGAITKLIENNNTLYCINERATSVVPLMEKHMFSEAQGGVMTEQKDVLGRTLQVLSDKYGSTHPNSVSSALTGVYYYDNNNICIVKASGNGIIDVSSYKIESFLYKFNNKFQKLPSGYTMEVASSYNNITGDIVFTFYVLESYGQLDSCSLGPLNNDYISNLDNIPTGVEGIEMDNIPKSERKVKIHHAESVYYNERLEKWVSRLSYNPMIQFNLGKEAYSFNLLTNPNRIYEHESNDVNYSYFYDSQHTFSFEFIINKDSYMQKILDNFMVISNREVPIFIDYKTDPKFQVDSLEEYSLDSRQNPLERRHEIKVMGISLNDNYYLNILNRDNADLDGYEWTSNGIEYKIASMPIEDPALIGTIYEGLYLLVIEYNSGSGWNTLNNDSEYYKNPFGITLEIDKINITQHSSDYIEDILYIQVQQNNKLSIRDKVFKIRMEYDGINHTYINAVITNLRLSLN